jgi:hypothetical protein
MNPKQKQMENLRRSDAKKFRKELGLWYMCDKTIHHDENKVCYVLQAEEHLRLHNLEMK